MKAYKWKSLIAAIALALAVAVPVTIAVTGCNTTQQSITYKTLYSLEKTTTAGVDAYYALVIQGKVPTNDVPRVAGLYNQFQAGMLLASSAAQFNTNALAPASLVVESQDLINLITTIKNGGH